MGPEELAELEKAQAEAAQRQAKPEEGATAAADAVEAVVDVAASGIDIGKIADGTLDAAGSAVEVVADVAGGIVGAIGSVLDGL